MLNVLLRHGFAHSRGFLDEDFEGLNRLAIAELAGVSRPSVSAVESAIASQVLRATPGLPLSLSASSGFVVCVEWGPRIARVGLSDLFGQLWQLPDDWEGPRFETNFDASTGPREYLDWTADAIERLLGHHEIGVAQLIGLGVARAAPINQHSGKAHPSGLPNLAWEEVNAVDQLRRRLGWSMSDVPGWTDNDASLSALAERTFGAARDLEDFAYIKWSDHIAAGLIFNGEAYRGSAGYAGQIGHMRIDWRGEDRLGRAQRRCETCRRDGCLQTKAGVGDIEANLRDVIAKHGGVNAGPGAGARLRPEDAPAMLFRLAERDPTVKAQLHYAVGLVGETVASLVDSTNPGGLLLGGWIGSALHDHGEYMETFRQELDFHVMRKNERVDIRRPTLRRSALQGAALRVIDERLMEWAPRRTDDERAAYEARRSEFEAKHRGKRGAKAKSKARAAASSRARGSKL